MTLYRICLGLHLAATFFWLGHMFFWSLFAGPVMKRVEPPETATRLREISLRMGGLGWPALIALIATGIYMLSVRGIGLADLFGLEFYATTRGRVLGAKLLLVTGMVTYQAIIGHRTARRAIYLDMLAAMLILAASAFLARS